MIARAGVTLRLVLLAGAAGLPPMAARAQSPVASSFATKDGRASTVIMACPTANSTYFAEFCGIAGYPLHVTVDSGTVSVTGSSGGGSSNPTTMPGTASAQLMGVQGGGSGALPIGVSASALPLPTGASTSALQPQLDPSDAGSWVHVRNFPATQPVSGSVSVSNLPATQPVSGAVGVSSLPALPAGSNAIGSVSVSNLPATQPVSGSVAVSNFPATQPVSGSVSVSNLPSTQAVSVAALPLPAGAATAALQPAINADGGALVHITNLGSSSSGGVASTVSVSNFPSTQPVSGSVGVSSLPALPAGTNAIGSVNVSNFPSTQAVSAASLPLPAGAATAALQPALNSDGGALAHVSNFPATQAISGTVGVSSLPALPAGSNAIGSVSVGNFPSTQAVSAASLPLPTGAATAALQPALNSDGGALHHITNFPATQAVSAASLPLPAGAATAALQPALNSDGGALHHITNFPATQAVSGSVGVSSLPALPAGSNAIGSVSVGNFPSTQAVSAASLPLPTGAATAALQPALNSDGGALAHISNFPATQAVSGTVGVSSLPALPAGTNAIGSVSVSNFPSTQAVSAASLPLPAGAATASGVAAVVSALGAPLQAGGAVNVSSLPALPAGSNTIGAINVSTVPQSARSGAWTDASVTATASAAVPSGLAAVASRVGLHLWNVGSSTVCMNYTSTAAVSGSGCAAGSVPIPAGSAYLEDQPGNVSPEAISLICTGASCPLTIKVR